MSSSIELTNHAYRAVLSHLVDTEEQKQEIVNALYFEPSDLRDDFCCFLDNYLIKLEELIKTIQIVDKPTREKLKVLNHLPYVIIGSTVELESPNNPSTCMFRIISPYDASSSKIDLSYLSALGKSLMLKKPGDIIKAEINKNTVTYKIKSIRFDC